MMAGPFFCRTSTSRTRPLAFGPRTGAPIVQIGLRLRTVLGKSFPSFEARQRAGNLRQRIPARFAHLLPSRCADGRLPFRSNGAAEEIVLLRLLQRYRVGAGLF